MGDVFDAMDRARREQSGRAARRVEPSGGEGAAARRLPEPPAAGGEQPGLPIDAVHAAARDAAHAAAGDDLTSRSAGSRDPLGELDSLAQQPAPRDAPASQLPAMPLPAGLALPPGKGLNGYAREIIVHHDRGSIVTEQYRAIRTQVLARMRNRKLQVHVITSSAPEEGKSVTSINLSLAFAELKSQNTVLVECDLRRPSFSKLFDRASDRGMLQVLRGEMEIDEVLQPTVYPNLQFIPAGGRETEACTELLSSPRMAQVMQQLRDRYTHVFIDTPPVITVTDPCILGAMADEVLLVVRLNKTPTDIVDRAKRLLRASNCELAGVILTHLRQENSDYKYNNYYYTRRK
jgi:capsular exopolysaccharide synthesis family protein